MGWRCNAMSFMCWRSAAALPCSYACRPHAVLRHLLFLLVLPQEGPFIHSGGILGYLVGMGGSQLVQRCARGAPPRGGCPGTETTLHKGTQHRFGSGVSCVWKLPLFTRAIQRAI